MYNLRALIYSNSSLRKKKCNAKTMLLTHPIDAQYQTNGCY